MAGDIKVPVPFETLLGSIAELSLEDKVLLRESLDEQIEAVAEENSETEIEVREARNAYEHGDYVSVEDYLTRRQRGG
ncbi:MAG: hypothetical protein H0U04_13530 [Rubrobacter sp.]|nr:hypothetical protein [Rubrobacter sp.]